MTGFAALKRRYNTARKIRKLRKLRTRVSAAGHTLKHFDEYRCIFIHIPKCAGVSVSRSLFDNHGPGHYSSVTMRRVFGDPTYNRYFTFTVVRNPWDRLASAYHFLKAGGFNEADRRWAGENLSDYADFNTFVRRWVNAKNIRGWVHFIPQANYLKNAEGHMDVDYIGHFESLQNDFNSIASRLDINRPLRTFNRGRTNLPRFQSLYNEETQAIVADVYAEDILTFGYHFE